MQPEETVYFANPGEGMKFNKAFYFHWANFNNQPINKWDEVVAKLLNIPMAHMLIGFYTIADTDEGVLKVMRSYQYYAAIGIADKVAKKNWKDNNQLGGHVWHTTGSGKTMTSFKSAQLIASSHDADKVIFLVDRKELGIQSLKEYRSFANESEAVQATENTDILISKLKSDDLDNTLIVTSIQKLSNISEDAQGLNEADLKIIKTKRIAIIIDECHRSTFGEMLTTIKNTFKNSVIFGFTGTPIQDVNIKKDSTTPTIFGDEIHRYTLADGIRDKNVLGFDPYMVKIFDDSDLRQAVALHKAKAATVEEVMGDPQKEKMFYKYMDSSQVKMYGEQVDGKWVAGIEDFIPNEQYQTAEYRNGVISDIKKKWTIYSRGRKFHAIFATSSIPEAVAYYRLMKAEMPNLSITAMFDPSIDNEGGGSLEKEDGIVEMLEDYNNRFSQTFTIPSYDKFRKDVSLRLAHKKPYERITQDEQIDILIVVNQMLTGFDSKWVNTLSFTLNTVDKHAVVFAIDRESFNCGQNYARNLGITEDGISSTLNAQGPSAVATPTYSSSKASFFTAAEEELVNTLVATDYKDPPLINDTDGIEYTVRRLTPTECARLQGFPDWWCSDLATENPTMDDLRTWYNIFETHRKVTGSSTKPKTLKKISKWLKDPHSDSAEYKMWGNGVALPCVYFVLSGIVFSIQDTAE